MVKDWRGRSYLVISLTNKLKSSFGVFLQKKMAALGNWGVNDF